MKFSFFWLKEILPIKHDAKEIAEILTSIGIEVEALEESDGDTIFHVGLTPNLGYAANIFGIAHELSALLEVPLNIPQFDLKEEGEDVALLGKITVLEPKACPRYLSRIITNVKVSSSPDWLKQKIEACGARSVNNIVDITNYVLFLCGHPLHAFDFERLNGREIIVRNAKPKEKIVTLNGKEHELTEETLVVADAIQPVTIAGVMGSLDSEVTTETRSVLLEAAYFDPKNVRRSAKLHGMHTEASHRFERGVDPNGLRFALDYAAHLIQTLAEGKVASGFLEVSSETFVSKEITLRTSRVNQLLGTSLSSSEIETILKRAGGKIKKSEGERLNFAFPTYRVDLNEEIDLIEEVARLYGYKNIFDHKKPTYYRSSSVPDHPVFTFEKKVRRALLKEGLQELLTCDLLSPDEATLLQEDISHRLLIQLLHPGSKDQSFLRPSLFPNLLKVVKYNKDHETDSLSAFELGRIHFKMNEEYHEPLVASIVLFGKKTPHQLGSPNHEVDFFDLKGILENVFESLDLSVTFKESRLKNFHPKRQSALVVNDHDCGILGAVHPKVLKKLGIEGAVYFAEFILDDLVHLQKKEQKMKPLAPFPSSMRDWTVKVPSHFSAGELLLMIKELESKLLVEFSLLDVYQSEKLGSEWKNITLRFVYRDQEQTISSKDVEEEHARITGGVMKQINLRGLKT